MNVNVNSMNDGARAAARLSASVPSGAPANGTDGRGGRDVADLTVSYAVPAPEEMAAAAVPESALSRDDALGRLVAAAFDCPPPPPPPFGGVAEGDFPQFDD